MSCVTAIVRACAILALTIVLYGRDRDVVGTWHLYSGTTPRICEIARVRAAVLLVVHRHCIYRMCRVRAQCRVITSRVTRRSQTQSSKRSTRRSDLGRDRARLFRKHNRRRCCIFAIVFAMRISHVLHSIRFGHYTPIGVHTLRWLTLVRKLINQGGMAMRTRCWYRYLHLKAARCFRTVILSKFMHDHP